MSGKRTVATTEPMIGTLRVQTSMYGRVQALVWGTTVLTGNLVWFGNFQTIAHTTTTSQGGKGGGVKQVDTKWEYRAAAVLGLCRGPINGIVSAWKGKQRLVGETVASRIDTLTHIATVPGSPYQVTVPGAAGFLDTASVVIPGTPGYSSREYDVGATPDRDLSAGVDYSVSAGVYSFAAGLVGQSVRITYRSTVAASTTSALAQLGMSLAGGTIGQPVWSWLQSAYPSEALAYSGLAYVYNDSYQLTNQAEVENLKFEVATGRQVNSAIPDADPADILIDFLTNPFYGVGWRTGRLAALTVFRSYVRARQLWLSPCMQEQRPAREWLQDLAQIANSEWTWQGGQLDLVPRGDAAISSGYGTYTPNVTPVFDLVHAEGGDLLGPVQIDPVVNEDAHNVIRIEWTNRANGYAIEVLDAKDAAHIELFGERPADVVAMHAIHDASVAQGVAQQLLQREMTVWNRYTFRTSWARALMSLMDLATLTDPDSALVRVPVRITARSEKGRFEYEWQAEDAPVGSASAPLYGSQAGSGYAPDYNADPGNVSAPVFLEAPLDRTTTGLEVYAAVSGTNTLWGGCRVWAALDGDANYKEVGRVYGGARYGSLAAAVAANATNLSLRLAGLGGQMVSGSAEDAQALNTLIWVDGLQGGEYLAYETATLTALNAYTLGGLVHGAFGSVSQSFAAGAAFVRVDDSLGSSGPLDLAYIGKAISFKFTSFNVFGGGEQSLADVAAYSYTITGAQALLPPPDVQTFSLDAEKLAWGPVVDKWLAGYEVRFQYGEDRWWPTAVPLHEGVLTSSPYPMQRRPQGTVTLLIKAKRSTGSYSANAAIIVVNLGDPLESNILLSWPQAPVFSGPKAGCSLVGPSLLADALDEMFKPADAPMFSPGAEPFFPPGLYSEMTYTWYVTPTAAGVLLLEIDVTGSGYTIEFLRGSQDAMFAPAAEYMFQPGSEPFFGPPAEWAVWPGAIDISAPQQIGFRIRISGGSVQGRIDAATVKLDVPDVSEKINDLAISPLGTRLPLTKAYNVIKNIQFTINADGNGGINARWLDKDPVAGPLAQIINSSNVPVAGVLDADIQGY